MKISSSHFSAVAVAAVTLTLCGCRVETKTEPVPEAEGSGKKAINIRVEPMSRDEIKNAVNEGIDKGAEAASFAKDAATSAVQNAEKLGQSITTLTDTVNTIRNNNAQPVTTTTP